MGTSKNPLARQIGRRLRAARTVVGLSRGQVAALIGVSTGTVGHWEAGRTAPRTDTLVCLCRALDAEPGWVLDVDAETAQ